MRYLMIAFLMLSACAKHHDADTVSKQAVCKERVSAYMVVFPDGQDTKSDVFDCVQTNGVSCNYFYWVNDHSINFTTCTEHLQ